MSCWPLSRRTELSSPTGAERDNQQPVDIAVTAAVLERDSIGHEILPATQSINGPDIHINITTKVHKAAEQFPINTGIQPDKVQHSQSHQDTTQSGIPPYHYNGQQQLTHHERQRYQSPLHSATADRQALSVPLSQNDPGSPQRGIYPPYRYDDQQRSGQPESRQSPYPSNKTVAHRPSPPPLPVPSGPQKPIQLPDHSEHKAGNKNHAVTGIVSGLVVFVLLALGFTVWYKCLRKKKAGWLRSQQGSQDARRNVGKWDADAESGVVIDDSLVAKDSG